MRVLVVGASGAIGTRLVPQLRQRGPLLIASSPEIRCRPLGSFPCRPAGDWDRGFTG
jgi:nucleoside-diphosphate-sugar epimerase